MTAKYIAIVLSLLFALIGLTQCEPGYYNCEGQKYNNLGEINARCVDYFK